MAATSQPRWSLETEDLGETTRVYFTGQDVFLDETNTELLGEQLFRFVEERGRCRLVLDLGNVTYLTSSTLGLMLVLHKKLQVLGGSLSLHNVLPHIYEIFAITNLTRLFEVRQDELRGCPS